MLTDLLTEREKEAEARTRHLQFDIDLLTARLATVTEWLADEPSTTECVAP